MKKYKNILIEINEHLGLLTLNRIRENNALNIDTSKEIYEGLKELEMNSSIRAILIQGNQKFFSPGADIKELNNLNSESAKLRGLFNYFDKIKEIISQLEAVKNEPSIKKAHTERPNIDHLIKRILVERRKKNAKNILILSLFVLIVGSIMIFSFNE